MGRGPASRLLRGPSQATQQARASLESPLGKSARARSWKQTEAEAAFSVASSLLHLNSLTEPSARAVAMTSEPNDHSASNTPGRPRVVALGMELGVA